MSLTTNDAADIPEPRWGPINRDLYEPSYTRDLINGRQSADTDIAFDPGRIPEDECGLIDWSEDEAAMDPVRAAELILRLSHDSDQIVQHLANQIRTSER